MAGPRHFASKISDLVDACGLQTLRYSVPWHTIEKRKGKYDWRWMDRAMQHMRMLGIDPILDPLHHTSFPSWLAAGFANPEFPELYLKFVTALADRYPWARSYTVINEPFVTTWFCGREATWYPYFKGDAAFVPMLMNVVEASVPARSGTFRAAPCPPRSLSNSHTKHGLHRHAQEQDPERESECCY